MRASEWIERFAEELGADAPGEQQVDDLLELAATAAHSSERVAAPIACFLAGATGTGLERAKLVAESIAERGGGEAVGEDNR